MPLAPSDFTAVTDLTAVPDRLIGGVVAIGNFDGVHRGHAAVLETAANAWIEVGSAVQHVVSHLTISINSPTPINAD